MIKLDDNLLTELGLGVLPKEEKSAFLKHMYETLEMRVGTRLAQEMTDSQMAEFEQFINGNDEQGAFHWLETNFPNYKQVVQEEFDKLKSEIRPLAPQIVAGSQAHEAQAAQSAQQTPSAASQQPAQPAAPPSAAPVQAPQSDPYGPMQPQAPVSAPASHNPMPQSPYGQPSVATAPPAFQASQPAGVTHDALDAQPVVQPYQPSYSAPQPPAPAQMAPPVPPQPAAAQPQYGSAYGGPHAASPQSVPYGQPAQVYAPQAPSAQQPVSTPISPAPVPQHTPPPLATPPTFEPQQPQFGAPPTVGRQPMSSGNALYQDPKSANTTAPPPFSPPPTMPSQTDSPAEGQQY